MYLTFRKILATGLCFAERNIYTAEALAVVLQQLLEQPSLPTLFMRTVIQTLTHYPKLLSFIMNVLQRLITKQVCPEIKHQYFCRIIEINKTLNMVIVI